MVVMDTTLARAVVRKNENLLKSRGGIMVNGAPREIPWVLYGLPREYIEGPPRDFLLANPRPHPWPDPRPKTLGACGPSGFWPWVWPRMWPWVCLQKIPRETFNILPREVHWVLSGTSLGAPFTMIPPRLFNRLSQYWCAKTRWSTA